MLFSISSGEPLSVSDAGTGNTSERAVDLHVVRTADRAADAGAESTAMMHAYDGTPNDGFCECGKASDDPIHESWQRSLRIQRATKYSTPRTGTNHYE